MLEQQKIIPQTPPDCHFLGFSKTMGQIDPSAKSAALLLLSNLQVFLKLSC
jgi:hypothetical protein